MEKREEFEELVMHASTNYEILKNLNGKDLKDVRDTAYFKAHTGGKPAEAKILYSKLQKKCDEILKQMRKI